MNRLNSNQILVSISYFDLDFLFLSANAFASISLKSILGNERTPAIFLTGPFLGSKIRCEGKIPDLPL